MINSGYINYIREIKSKDKILQIQIKILKKDISNLQKELIKNQIDKLEKIYPHTFVKEFRLYLKSHDLSKSKNIDRKFSVSAYKCPVRSGYALM